MKSRGEKGRENWRGKDFSFVQKKIVRETRLESRKRGENEVKRETEEIIHAKKSKWKNKEPMPAARISLLSEQQIPRCGYLGRGSQLYRKKQSLSSCSCLRLWVHGHTRLSVIVCVRLCTLCLSAHLRRVRYADLFGRYGRMLGGIRGDVAF